MKWGKKLFIGIMFATQFCLSTAHAEEIRFQGGIAEFTCGSQSQLADCEMLSKTQARIKEDRQYNFQNTSGYKPQTVSRLDVLPMETDQHKVLLVQYH